MRQTVLGVFDSYADARSAQRTLGEAGIAQADIAIYSLSNDAPIEKGPRVYAPGSGDVRHHNPVFDQLEQLFARLFKSGQYPPETEDYRELIRSGGTIVSADVSEMQVGLARDLMRRTGATDIEERAKVWRNGSVKTGLPEQALHRGSSTTRDHANAYEPSSAQQGDAIVPGGQVVGTAPSSETKEYPASPRDASPVPATPRASTSEKPAAGRTVMQGTATSSSARAKMVGGMEQVATRTEGLGPTASMHDGTSETKTEQTSGTGLVGDPVTGTPLYDASYDDEFREDYAAHYASTGASYDEYQLAYTHGATLGKDERYRGHDWQRVEADARENWESRYPESGWERFKAAVRHGWDRVTGG
jgi:hypothetical protein